MKTDLTGGLAAALLAAFALAGSPATAQTAGAGSGADSAEAAHAEAPLSAAERLDAVDAEIRSTLGHPYATEIVQCRFQALGRKPCGGPAEYLVYSTLGTDEAALRDLVRRYNALALAGGRGRSEVGDCAYLPPPRLELRDSLCVTAQ